MQQGGGEGGSQSQSQSQSQYGEITPPVSETVSTHMLVGGIDQSQQQQHQLVEAASPISSRPPATGNLDELMRLSAAAAAGGSGLADEDALMAAGDIEGERGGGVSGGNRWPRQETLALLKIRSDMDAAFRDATIKGPLWEDVSRKLAELGYKRNAKKCKEKFENVHKYYKRTKEGRAGRQDGKSYKFFSQLEALHNTATSSYVSSSPAMPVTTVATTTNTTSLDVAPVSIGIPMPISSSVRIQPSISPQLPSTIGMSSSIFPPNLGATIPGAVAAPAPATTSTPIGISFSSNGSSSSPSTEDDDDDDDDEFEGGPSNTAGSSRKRKRQSSKGGGSSSTHRMMEFFEGLMKQVMQKQEAMQQRFLEAIEKREQDRMIREEAWKRQEMARLAREHELMAQERAISASRDAAIISFLQKITGQTIQLPTPVTIPATLQPVPAAAQLSPMPTPSPPQPPPSLPQQQQQQQPHRHHQHQQQQQQQVHHHHHHHLHQQSQNVEVVRHQPPISSEVVMAVPEQQIPPQDTSGGGGSGSFEPMSSRWPKAEVLALIKLRSELEYRYQEAGPKGPLWEEISAGMQRMGYKRSSKRCKEKWENINKYFKKVKESNKKRPEDAKTCPYFHQLDALYRKKILGSSSGGGGDTSTSQEQPPQQQQESINLNPIPPTNPQDSCDVSAIIPAPQLKQTSESENKNGGSANVPGSPFGEGNGGAAKKPEDIVKELMEQQGIQQQQQLIVEDEYDKIEEPDSENIDHEDDEDEDEEDDEDDEELQEDSKMAYKIEFQRQNTSASNGGGNGAASFLAMVQ